MIFSLPVAIAVAWLLARRQFLGPRALSALVHLPLVLPPVVTGYLLLLTFGRQGGWAGAWPKSAIVLAFRWTGAALAAAVMGFPLDGARDPPVDRGGGPEAGGGGGDAGRGPLGAGSAA